MVESFRPLQDRLNAIGTFRVGVPEVRLWDPPQNLCNIWESPCGIVLLWALEHCRWPEHPLLIGDR